MTSKQFSPSEIDQLLKEHKAGKLGAENKRILETDVFIAGSGPIASTYARIINEDYKDTRILMVEIGKQESPVIGEHHKNSVKYQKDIDAFVNVIKGALQPVSIPPSETYIATLGGNSWAPGATENLVIQGHNPSQLAQGNLPAAAVTRAVGGMATHWTCCCPVPHTDETEKNPIIRRELYQLLADAGTFLNVKSNEYDNSIRHTYVKETLQKAFPNRGVGNLPLGVQRNSDNPAYVTWTGTNTILGEMVNDLKHFELRTETRVTKVIHDPGDEKKIVAALIRNLRNDCDYLVFAKAFIIACGSICTPQILFNSKIDNSSIGKNLCEQSIAFCQIVLKRDIIESIRNTSDARFKDRVKKHVEKHPGDLPIPFDDPEPQVYIPYDPKVKCPWHVQVHRDAFSYGDVGPKADPRVIVDLRFFGKQDSKPENLVAFDRKGSDNSVVTDIYGMPQATFEVHRSREDGERDQLMMEDMCKVASELGSFLPGSNPQFMEPGLALHITGTTRIGTDKNTSVADSDSKVHGYQNLWVGGNGCIPDSMACNPTRTSVAIAIRGAGSVLEYLARTNGV